MKKINDLFAKNIEKMAQPIQFTNPVLEKSQNGEQADFNNLPTPSPQKEKIPSQKQIIGEKVGVIQANLFALSEKMELISAFKRDSNSEEALRLVKDAWERMKGLKEDLSNLGLI